MCDRATVLTVSARGAEYYFSHNAIPNLPELLAAVLREDSSVQLNSIQGSNIAAVEYGRA